MTSLKLVPVPPVAQLEGVSQHYGKTAALNNITLDIPARSMVGLIGPDGVGKSSLLSLISGARVIEQGNVIVLGGDMRDAKHRRDVCPRIAWMPQGLGKNLYHTLSVYENVDFFARLFGHDKAEREARITELLNSTGLAPFRDRPAGKLSGGMKQKLGLCCALIHDPELLILDEPTSGVDPVARDMFWQLMVDLSRQDKVTIFISTHFMNEAERCDRMSLMHAGKVLASGTPQELVQQRGAANLEAAFISWLQEAAGAAPETPIPPSQTPAASGKPSRQGLSFRRLFSYSRREALELRRDPVRSTLALLGTVILMLIMGYGISMDVENLRFAVLDRDQTVSSQAWSLNLAGSRYFIEQPPLASYDELDRRMRSGELAVAIEIPPNFGRDIARGTPAQIGVWVDGAMPSRAETVKGYVQAMHQSWLQEAASRQPNPVKQTGLLNIETRYRYGCEKSARYRSGGHSAAAHDDPVNA